MVLRRRLQSRLTRLILLAGIGAFAAAACSGGDDEDLGDTSSQAEYLICTEPAGSWTDLTGEDPAWRDQPSVNWTDEDQCAVRLDHVWHHYASDHCDWEQVETISFGLPLGTPYTGPDATPPGQDWDPFFLFNTDGAMSHLPAGERIAAAEVPANAMDTGLRTVTGRSLFLAADDSALYDVQGDTAQVFVRIDAEQADCA